MGRSIQRTNRRGSRFDPTKRQVRGAARKVPFCSRVWTGDWDTAVPRRLPYPPCTLMPPLQQPCLEELDLEESLREARQWVLLGSSQPGLPVLGMGETSHEEGDEDIGRLVETFRVWRIANGQTLE